MLDGEALVNLRCTICHSRARIDNEDKDLEGWTEIVTRMQSYGAQLTAQEKQTVIAYLVATHGKDHDGDSGGDDVSGKGRGRGRGGDDNRDSDDD